MFSYFLILILQAFIFSTRERDGKIFFGVSDFWQNQEKENQKAVLKCQAGIKHIYLFAEIDSLPFVAGFRRIFHGGKRQK
jgi:hypothetical protein